MSENSKMVHVKSTCNQVYANKYLKAGDPFPFAIPAHVAASLIKNHYAVIDGSYQTRARPSVARKDLIADDPPAEEASSDEIVAQAEQVSESETAEQSDESETAETATTRRQSRRYKTRDLKADEQ